LAQYYTTCSTLIMIVDGSYQLSNVSSKQDLKFISTYCILLYTYITYINYVYSLYILDPFLREKSSSRISPLVLDVNEEDFDQTNVDMKPHSSSFKGITVTC
jgi:hypothetical protein